MRHRGIAALQRGMRFRHAAHRIAGAMLPFIVPPFTVMSFIVLLLHLAPPPLAASPQGHPFPPALGRPNPMRAPGLLSGPRIPLGSHPASGYHAILARGVEGGQRPLFLGLLGFYRTAISPVNGSNSDLAPVPSLYAVQAIKEYGVLLGTVLTTERLIHEPGEIPLAPAFTENGREFHYDPLLWNVYWLPDWLR